MATPTPITTKDEKTKENPNEQPPVISEVHYKYHSKL